MRWKKKTVLFEVTSPKGISESLDFTAQRWRRPGALQNLGLFLKISSPISICNICCTLEVCSSVLHGAARCSLTESNIKRYLQKCDFFHFLIAFYLLPRVYPIPLDATFSFFSFCIPSSCFSSHPVPSVHSVSSSSILPFPATHCFHHT